MRLTYFLTVIVVATLHAGGTALATAEAPNHAAIVNVASADNVHSLDTTAEIGGRMLRKVKEDTVSKKDHEERGPGAILERQTAFVKKLFSRQNAIVNRAQGAFQRQNAFVNRDQGAFQRQNAFVKRAIQRQNHFKLSDNA
ncbi:avirulence protein 1b [Phytophthora sojae]|uniref:RxLR effector protein Avh23 n=2 Tax=Phytophthora sojae TaxID=67593 RepID=AVH23_PHYSP|nr:avirulence protein 1b [Phytophthora sojae]E0W544.1 RecName: Full=RxLR effector protein Avh23; AltName: Full=Avirulence homolog protein 23; Flags: Precursor [Phytophthora sojae]G4ZJX4.1 RecName: Full=RxLR effector protein Avh23; AltName: Full=Avirulence homolog protein 23; Flags: Precursor [Phytophthora sojae strain P6497]AEK80501.1 Avh23 [Phytophthora sojae]AEK80502.1 Avh23 [Phytophthora sojae]AEK80503.1 Avh23 [Phytophthora sojae]EGZ14456.1 avirulence protein 1b [Phytophthora sojae]|eukprot:XP_009528205.1 avirulence protein 1b [Phytophthora sojae]